MPRLTILYDQEGWCAERRARALAKHAPPGWDVETVLFHQGERPLLDWTVDIILMTTPHCLGVIRKHRKPGAMLVATYNTAVGNVKLLARCLNVADHVISNCGAAALGDSVTHLPVGVDLDEFYITRTERPMRAVWCAGVLKQRSTRLHLKGVGLAGEVAAALKRKKLDHELFKVDPHGKRKTTDEMRDWYNGARVLFVTSDREGVPNVALEAAACGCSIVGPPVGVLPELIQHGQNGYIADWDARNIARHIVQACENWHPVSSLARAMVDNFGWHRRAKAYYEYLGGLL